MKQSQTAIELPEGFVYQPEFISKEEEAALVEAIRQQEFSQIKMHGVVAKRRVIHYGWVYGYESWKLMPGPPIPDFLLPLRSKVGEWLDKDPDEFSECW